MSCQPRTFSWKVSMSWAAYLVPDGAFGDIDNSYKRRLGKRITVQLSI